MKLSPVSEEERLNLWKKLRISIEGVSLYEKLNSVANFCKNLPIGPRSVDYYDPKTWPTPWEILFYGSFCRSSVSILMFYTLTLSDPGLGIELWVVKDNEGDYLLPIINNQFILNYQSGMVSNYQDIHDYFIVMEKFTKTQIKTVT